MAELNLDRFDPVVSEASPQTPEMGFGLLAEAEKTGENVDSGSLAGSECTKNGQGSYERQQDNNVRAEIDTSAPFESVKEAASRFGGIGFWKPLSRKPTEPSETEVEVIDIANVEEQAAKLERDLIMKERETLDVLKELEMTKLAVEELKLQLQKESVDVGGALHENSDCKNTDCAMGVAENEFYENLEGGQHHNAVSGLELCPSSAPGFILLELKQAKLNLTRTTNDITDIRATVESFNKKIEKERLSLEKTRQRLSSNSLKISSLEEEINQTKLKLQLVKYAGAESSSDPMDISKELQKLSSEAEQFKKIGEAAKSEVSRAMSEIEQTKGRMKTAEIRLVAARKMKEAASASEAIALAEIKALSKGESSSVQQTDGVTLTFEEYSSLNAKALDAEEVSRKRVRDAMLHVDEANISKTEILKKVEDAVEEVKTSKKALEEALNRVEAANKGKLAVEEALRKWRSEHGQKKRSLHNSTKFKISCPSHRQKDSRLLDVNGLNLLKNEAKPVLNPTLSIGQILSRKLLLTEEYESGIRTEKGSGKRKVSLAQMLSKSNGELSLARKGEGERECGQKQQPPLGKRKKFGFSRISILVTKPSKKKKRQTASSMCRSV